ncbi:MAG: hypothetical protein ACLQME_13740 [Alphaproteobacteria bacterium]
MSNDSTTKSRPTHRVYSVTKNEEGKATWLEIGAAWSHKDGKGFNLTFKASPFGESQVVIRAIAAKKEAAA